MAAKNEVRVIVRGDTAEMVNSFKAAEMQAEKFAKALKKTDKEAQTLETVMRDLGTSTAILRGPLDGIAGRFSALATGIGRVNPAMLGFGVGAAATVATVAKMIPILSNAESQMMRLEAVLQATGYASGFSARKLDEMARKMGENTLASVDGVRQAQAVLLTFRTIAGDTFERTLKLAQDMADTGFGNLESNAIQLGKALENPIAGLSSLTDSGITFTNGQKETIKQLVRAGELYKAQAMILEQIDGQLGGVAERQVGFASAMDLMGQRSDEFLENLGNRLGILRTFTNLVTLATNVMGSASEAVKGPDENERLIQLYDQIEIQQRRIDEFNRQIALTDDRTYALQQERRKRAHVVKLEELKAEVDTILQASRDRAEEERLIAEKAAKSQAEIARQATEELARTRREDAEKTLEEQAQAIAALETQAAGKIDARLKAEKAYTQELLKIIKARNKAQEQGILGEPGVEYIFGERVVAAYKAYQATLSEIAEKESKARLEQQIKNIKEESKLKLEELQRVQALESTRGNKEGDLAAEQARLDMIRERARAELQIIEMSGQASHELRQSYRYKDQLAVEEHQAKKAKIYQKYFQETFDKEEEAHLAHIERRNAAMGAFEVTARSMKEALEDQQGAGFEAYKAMAIAEAGISAARAQLSVLADQTLPYWAKPPMMAAMAALSATQIAKIYSSNSPQGRAAGGPVSAGSPYFVGEMGRRELFVPSTNGSIIPEGKLRGNTTVNIIENSARGGQTEEAEDGSLNIFVAAVKASVIRDIQRGTGIGSMVQRRGYR